MFDVGFSELVVIAIVALVVIGPERLPRVARTAGVLFGRLQRYVNDVKSDISREIQLDELKRLQSEIQESARSFEHSMKQEIQSVEQSLRQTAETAEAEIKAVAAELEAGVETPPAVKADAPTAETAALAAPRADTADKT